MQQNLGTAGLFVTYLSHCAISAGADHVVPGRAEAEDVRRRERVHRLQGQGAACRGQGGRRPDAEGDSKAPHRHAGRVGRNGCNLSTVMELLK